MKARMQMALLKMNDPRAVRIVLAAVAVALAAFAQIGVQPVYAGPATGGGGCLGG